MRKMIGSTALLCGISLLAGCGDRDTPKAEQEASVEAPKTAADAATMLTSLKADAVEGLNVPVTIQLDKNGNPQFIGSVGSGIVCGNPDCQPPSLNDKSFGFDGAGNLILNNWGGRVNFIVTVAAPGWWFPKEPRQAIAVAAGIAPPGKDQWDPTFVRPTGTPDRLTVTFGDTNTTDGVWEYSVTIQNKTTNEFRDAGPHHQKQWRRPEGA